MDRKLPYIQDQDMYVAIKCTASMANRTGKMDEAVAYFADKYKVNPVQLKEYADIMLEDLKKDPEKAKTKYRWYAVEYSSDTTRFQPRLAKYTVVRSIHPENVQENVRIANDKDGYHYDAYCFNRIEEYETRHEAMDRIQQWRKEKAAMFQY